MELQARCAAVNQFIMADSTARLQDNLNCHISVESRKGCCFLVLFQKRKRIIISYIMPNDVLIIIYSTFVVISALYIIC